MFSDKSDTNTNPLYLHFDVYNSIMKENFLFYIDRVLHYMSLLFHN